MTTLDQAAKGDQLLETSLHFTRDSLVRYAGASGDFNPIHYRDDIATEVGLPGVLAHGMLTMGLGAGVVSEFTGDPGAVTRYSVRLSSPAVVPHAGSEIEFSGKIKSLDPETRTGVVLLVAKSGGRKIFGMATLDVRFS